MLEITDSMRNNKFYDGNTRKFGITIDNVDYIVKFPKKNNLSVYCEYVASNFIRNLGIPCHSVYLGFYNNVLVNIIKDFTSNTDFELHSFKDTKQSSEDTSISTKEYTYSDILYLIDKHLKINDTDKVLAKEQFWKMFICDAILANRDRHWGNWGYLSKGSEYKFAPIYDNGACLFPDINLKIAEYVNEDRKNFLWDRIEKFPASLFKIKRSDRAYRTNYYEMFSDLRFNRIFAKLVKNLKSNLSYFDVFNNISSVVFNIESLDVVYKRFFIEIVTLRYMCIILRMNYDKAYNIVENLLCREGL